MAKKKKTKETVLVTGAGGTVGGYVVPLLLESDYRVVAADMAGIEWPFETGSDDLVLKEGDLTELAFCIDATEGVDYVIHLAASLDLTKTYEEIAPINVDAVRYLYEGARARKAKRFVFFSSGSIYRQSSETIDEESPIQPEGVYEQSKVDAESYLWSRGEDGPEVTIIRPSMIYGPRGRHLGALLGAAVPMMAVVRNRVLRLKGGPTSNWVHAEDVARAAVFLMERKEAAGEIYNVADNTPLPFGDILATVTEAFGLETGTEVDYPRRLLRLVGPLLARREWFFQAINLALDRYWGFIRERYDLEPHLRPSIDRSIFVYALRDIVFSNEKLLKAGFKLKYPDLREGYADVLRWYQSQNYVPSYDRVGSEGSGSNLGFEFEETMAGTWTKNGKEKGFSFTTKVVAPGIREFVKDWTGRLEGTVDAEGLADGTELTGTLEIALLERRQLVYEFDFGGSDGRSYRFIGKKNVKWWNPVGTMTRLVGHIYDEEGNEWAEATLHFDLRRDLLDFIRSFSLHREPVAVA